MLVWGCCVCIAQLDCSKSSAKWFNFLQQRDVLPCAGHLADAGCEGDHSSRKLSFHWEASKVEILDVVEGGFGVRHPAPLSLGFVSVLNVWTHLRFQLPTTTTTTLLNQIIIVMAVSWT